MNPDTPLIITGMHRSGTSLVAGFVHHSGIHLGEEFLGARRSNPYGHFEDTEILDFQRGILIREFGHDLWVPRPPVVTSGDRDRARALARARRTRAHWGWKEPRTTLFLEMWHGILPKACFLLLVRHPSLVVDSLHRRAKTRFFHIWRHNKFLRAWLMYNRTLFAFYRSRPECCLLVTLEGLLGGVDSFVASLSELLSYPLDGTKFHNLYDPSILARKKPDRLLIDPRLVATSVALYDCLQGHSTGQNQTEVAV